MIIYLRATIAIGMSDKYNATSQTKQNGDKGEIREGAQSEGDLSARTSSWRMKETRRPRKGNYKRAHDVKKRTAKGESWINNKYGLKKGRGAA